VQKPFELLVAGEINPDLILSDPNLEARFGQTETLVKEAALTIGSSSVIFACGAARLGLKTAFIGVVGKDLFGEFMLQAMATRGIDTSPVILDAQQQTGMSVILNRGPDRAILTHLGSMNALRASDLSDDLLSKTAHLHISSYFLQTKLQPGLPSLLHRAHSLGLTVSLDTNWDPKEAWKGLNELLPLTDIFLPNQNEALAISGSADIEQALGVLSKVCPTVAIKLGREGAIAQHGKEIIRLPALPVRVVDTVGAGDSFDAGFLFGRLQGWDLESSLALGIVYGSLSTTKPGGTDGQPNLEEALQALPKILSS